MSAPIKPGDTVLVVGAGCKHSEADLGAVFTVRELIQNGHGYCHICFAAVVGAMAVPDIPPAEIRGRRAVKPVSWLRRIDGTDLLQDELRERELQS